MTYLLNRKVAHGPKWYTSRRQPVLAVVLHVTAGLEDLDATEDQSAERTAAYAATTDRKVSWHQGTDTDSNLVLLPDSYTAFHVAGYNSCTLGREISKRHTDWRTMPAKWVQATLGNAAPADAEWCRLHNIPVRKATRRELDAAIGLWQRSGAVVPVGFISHAELDPSRRTDPGFVRSVDTFPWTSYLELVRHHLNGTPTTSQEDDMAPHVELIKWHYRRSRGATYDPATDPNDRDGFASWMLALAGAQTPGARNAVVTECGKAIDAEIAAKPKG